MKTKEKCLAVLGVCVLNIQAECEHVHCFCTAVLTESDALFISVCHCG